MTNRTRHLVQLILILVLSACTPRFTAGASIEARDAWARAVVGTGMQGQLAIGTPQPGEAQVVSLNSAAYLSLRNNSTSPDRLLRVESDIAEAVEIHNSEMTGEVMSMRPVDYVEIPAHSDAELKPGGAHIMLIGLKSDLKAGEKIPLVLVFEKFGRLEVQAEVRAP